ncbi:MAG: tetratricopeptide repeat protein [Myxococcota bacterium]
MLSALLVVSLCAAPTPAELEKFGRDLAADLSAGKDTLSRQTDYETLVARALRDLDTKADWRKGLTQGFKQGFAASWEAVARTIADGGSVTFKKVITLDGEQGVQLRVLFKEGAFNFLELPVRKDASGALKIIDVWELTAGTSRSEDLRLLAVPVLGDIEKGVLDRLLGKDSAISKHVGDLRKMNEAIRDGRPKEAATIYAALPKEVQEHRLFLRAHVSAVMDDDAAYEKAMGRYLALYPGDTAAQVMGIDYYFLRKNWPKCLAAIAEVEKRTGPDAWFEFLRASAAMTQKDWPVARKHLEAAVAREPTLANPYYTLIDVTMAQKKFGDTAKWLDATEKAVGVQFDIAPGTAGFEDFVASKEGKAWLKKRPVKK